MSKATIWLLSTTIVMLSGSVWAQERESTQADPQAREAAELCRKRINLYAIGKVSDEGIEECIEAALQSASDQSGQQALHDVLILQELNPSARALEQINATVAPEILRTVVLVMMLPERFDGGSLSLEQASNGEHKVAPKTQRHLTLQSIWLRAVVNTATRVQTTGSPPTGTELRIDVPLLVERTQPSLRLRYGKGEHDHVDVRFTLNEHDARPPAAVVHLSSMGPRVSKAIFTRDMRTLDLGLTVAGGATMLAGITALYWSRTYAREGEHQCAALGDNDCKDRFDNHRSLEESTARLGYGLLAVGALVSTTALIKYFADDPPGVRSIQPLPRTWVTPTFDVRPQGVTFGLVGRFGE